MKIVYAGTLPPHPGGSAVLAHDLLAGLARRGHSVTALAPMTAEAAAAGEPLADAPYALRRFPVPIFESAPNTSAPFAYRDAERDGLTRHLPPLLSAGCDLVVAGRETFALTVPEIAHAAGLPCVVLAQGGTLWGLVARTHSPALHDALVAGLARADRIVAVARHVAPHLRALGLTRIDVVPNAVDPEVFAPGPPDAALRAALALDDHGPVVLHVSNLKALKRPLDVAHAAAVALPREPRLWFVVVGEGAGRAQIDAEATRLGIRTRFRFTGWVPRAEVARYLRLADLVVMPSEAEALALVYLETLACGRVLIASDIAAAREVVRDGETGLLFPAGDTPALAACIVRAAGDASLRAAIGARARAWAARHPLARALDAYERVFAATVAGTAPR